MAEESMLIQYTMGKETFLLRSLFASFTLSSHATGIVEKHLFLASEGFPHSCSCVPFLQVSFSYHSSPLVGRNVLLTLASSFARSFAVFAT